MLYTGLHQGLQIGPFISPVQDYKVDIIIPPFQKISLREVKFVRWGKGEEWGLRLRHHRPLPTLLASPRCTGYILNSRFDCFKICAPYFLTQQFHF